MPQAPPRKPSSAKKSFSPSKGQLQCAAGALIIALIIGLSHVLSPTEDDSVPPSTSTAVTALDDVSFDKFVGSHPGGVLVDFYTKTCGFCTKLAPEFEKAAQKLRASGGPPLASVDQETGGEIMKKLGIERFPTVLWFWKGKNVLELPRASEKPAPKIIEWAQWAANPAVQELETRAEFDEALPTLRSSLHTKARLMVAFNKPGSEGMREAFEEAAQRHRSTTVFLYIKEESAEASALKSFGQEESKDEVYEGAASTEPVVQWVKAALEKAKPPKPSDATAKALDQAEKALDQAEADAAEGDAKE